MYTYFVMIFVLFLAVNDVTNANAQILVKSLPPGVELSGKSKEPEDRLPTLEDDQIQSNNDNKKAPDSCAPEEGGKTGKIAVYGRTACGITKKYMAALEKAGIPFTFVDIDDPAGDREFSKRAAEAGLFGSIDLPVLDVDGKVSARPDLASLINAKKQPGTPDAQAPASANEDKSDGQVVIYGRTACGITKKYMTQLEKASIPYVFKDIDAPGGDREFTVAANKGGLSGSIGLPLVEVDGKVSSRPDLAALIKSKGKAGGSSAQGDSAAKEAKAKNAHGQLIVYGNPDCSITTKYVNELKEAGIPFTFKNIGERAIHKEFSQQMAESGISGTIDLPVVDNNGDVAIRPNLVALLKSKKPELFGGDPKNPEKSGSSPTQQKNPVIIYSVKSCEHTKTYMKELKELGIQSTFKDVDEPTAHKEFSKAVVAAGYSGSIDLPAVVIKGKVYIRPSLVKTIAMTK
jgi:arsenate reductase-like glutaredoxin family protein